MSKSKEIFTEERSNFYEQLKEGEEYATVSMKKNIFHIMQENFEAEEDYTLHGVKTNDPRYKEDKLLCELYSEKRKLSKKITEKEQTIKNKKK